SASPIRRAFGVVNSSSTRRQMILAAAEAYFGESWDDKNVRGSFSRVLEAISFASRRRDDIAHGIARRITLDQKPLGWFLFPANYNTERTKAFGRDKSDPLYFTFTEFRYTSDQIKDFARKFGELKLLVFTQTNLIRKLEDGSILSVKAVTD